MSLLKTAHKSRALLHSSIAVAIILAGIVSTGCVSKGLISDHHESEFYQVPRLLSDDIRASNPTFIVTGDTQADWRVRDKFLHPKNWITWKMALFPFYEIYWLGNGLIGTFNRLRQYADSGADRRLLMREAIYERALSEPADFILNTGDIVGPDGRRYRNWELFITENKHNHRLLDDIPYLPTIGNHDRGNDNKYGRKNFEAVFGYPLFYTVEFPDLELFVIDSDVIIDWKREIPDDEQNDLFRQWIVSDNPDNPAWLERKLNDSPKSFKVVSMHHCPVSFGRHFFDWHRSSFGQRTITKRKELLSLFERTGVQLVFSGHDHIYQHNLLRYRDKNDNEAVMHFVVSSSGGMPQRRRESESVLDAFRESYRSEGIDVEPLMQESRLHYCVVKTTSEAMQIQTFEVHRKTGTKTQLLDEFTIHRPN